MVNDQLAGKEMTIGRYYLRNGDTLAAVGRFKTVIDRYQTTTHTPEALYRLVEAYLTLGLLDEAKKNGAVLGFNYPGDAWYRDAYRLLTDKGLRPATEPNGEARRGGILSHLPFVKDKSKTVKPPGSDDAAATPASFLKSPGPADAATTTTTTADQPAAPAPKKKKKGLLSHIPFLH
jgi:outer membrane protein assembly factor BamD